MARKSREKRRARAASTPQKPDLDLSFSEEDDDNNKTYAPDEPPIPDQKTKLPGGTTGETPEDETDLGLTAPVRIPTQDDLAVYLVKVELVYDLEEYRADENRALGFSTLLISAILAVIINWVTSEPLTITPISIVTIVLLGIAAAYPISQWFTANKRAKNKREQIEREKRRN